jgi:hypothetical protein
VVHVLSMKREILHLPKTKTRKRTPAHGGTKTHTDKKKEAKKRGLCKTIE